MMSSDFGAFFVLLVSQVAISKWYRLGGSIFALVWTTAIFTWGQSVYAHGGHIVWGGLRGWDSIALSKAAFLWLCFGVYVADAVYLIYAARKGVIELRSDTRRAAQEKFKFCSFWGAVLLIVGVAILFGYALGHLPRGAYASLRDYYVYDFEFFVRWVALPFAGAGTSVICGMGLFYVAMKIQLRDTPSQESDASSIKFACHRCGRHFSIEAAASGSEVKCVDCGDTMVVPPSSTR